MEALKQRVSALQPPHWAALIFALTFIGDIVALRWVGVPLLRQLIFAGFLLVCTFAGALFVSRRAGAFPDRFTFLMTSLALGLLMHMLLCFAAYHNPIMHLLAIPDYRSSTIAVFLLLCVMAYFGKIYCGKRDKSTQFFKYPLSTALIFLFASGFTIAAHFGFGNDLSYPFHSKAQKEQDRPNTVVRQFLDAHNDPNFVMNTDRAPEWGGRIDSLWYVWLFSDDIAANGFPNAFRIERGSRAVKHDAIRFFKHAGVEMNLLGAQQLAGRFSAELSASFSKMLSLTWNFLITYWVLVISRAVFGLPGWGATLAALGSLFYAGLNITFFSGPLRNSSILNYIAATQWNLNQCAQLGIGLAGIYLLLADLKQSSGRYFLGCLLLAGSLFYKPSLFSVGVPAIGLASLWLGRNFFRAEVLAGWLVIVLACVFWFAYPRVLDLPPIESPIGFGFMVVQLHHGGGLLPGGGQFGDLFGKVFLFVLMFAGLAIPAFAVILDATMRPQRALRAAIATFRRPEYAAVWLSFLFGTIAALCLYEENNRKFFGSFLFGGGAAYILFLPILVKLLCGIQNTLLRRTGWAVYGAHLASGAANLYLYVVSGKIT